MIKDLGGAFTDTLMENIIDVFAKTGENPFKQNTTPSQQLPLTASFNAQQPQLNSQPEAPNVSVINTALNTKAPQVVEQNKLLNTDAGKVQQNINAAADNVKDAKAEFAKVENPGKGAGGDSSQPGIGRAVAANTIGGMVTGGLTSTALKAIGLTNPVFTAAAAAMSFVPIAKAVIGGGSFGDQSTESQPVRTVRGKDAPSEGYSRSTATPAPAMDNFNRSMNKVPGMSDLSMRASIAGDSLAGQEIKLGEIPLEKMKASLEQLDQKVKVADTALNRRADQGTTVGIKQGAEAILARDINPEGGAVRIADNLQTVRVFNNMV